ncbi:FadR/GntR family transcriptional regulator [Maritalea porphyrae]|uniref:FadR/GntR family transcriptional regulator n=1 Tax=Maritalea porphyrae TaxID=880732 RepID=UPI0022AE5A25|nr:FadR/GntR family transcriptional regulator [Maritalea porphyrae]MCZ4271916.1 FadR/GntR family transcriptional regulator [Maritalea porphyrae]
MKSKSKKQESSKSAAMLLPKIERKSRTAEVLDALVKMIEAADLQVGDTLPSETLLADQLGVGRSTIREALNRWEGLGLVRRRRGSGTYITANIKSSKGLGSTTTKLEAEGLLRILDVRRTLENEVARRAAQNISDNQIEKMRAAYKKMERLVNEGMRWREADHEFHAVIYEASGNTMFGRVIRDVDDAFHASKVSNSPFEDPVFGFRSVPLHENLCEAIANRDPAAAIAAITTILDLVEQEVRSVSET